MKTKRSFLIAFTTILAIVAIGAVGRAQQNSQGQQPAPCSLVGTWSGWADQNWSDTANNPPSLAWTSIQTADSSGTTGEMLLNWVHTPGDLSASGNAYPTYLTPGHGVWKLNGSQYNYTWYAYYYTEEVPGTEATIYSVRVFGNLTPAITVTGKKDCNNFNITYTIQVFEGMVAPQDMNNPANILNYHTSGYAGETKVPLVLTIP